MAISKVSASNLEGGTAKENRSAAVCKRALRQRERAEINGLLVGGDGGMNLGAESFTASIRYGPKTGDLNLP